MEIAAAGTLYDLSRVKNALIAEKDLTRNRPVPPGRLCHKCSKKSHYSSVCRSKAVATVSEEQLGNSSFLDTIHETKGTSWTALIEINSQEILFKLDTGAEATAISTRTFKTLKNIKLQKSAKVLCGSNNQPLNVLGQAVVQLTYKGSSCKQPIYIIEDLKNNLLGLPALTVLQSCQ